MFKMAIIRMATGHWLGKVQGKKFFKVREFNLESGKIDTLKKRQGKLKVEN